MQVKLKVIGGKNDGREIKISVPEFLIGRGEGTHLRPQSDLISRHHCVITVKDGKVVVKDLSSRNGTYVNGERIEGELQVKAGDRFRVGRLQFEILIDHSAASSKKPKVEGVREAAARTAGTAGEASAFDDESITDWLSEDEESGKTNRRVDEPETQQLKLDETDRVVLEEVSVTEEIVDSSEDASQDSSESVKRKPGKLPKRPMDSIDSRDAASQMLRKFFNRR